MTPTSTPFPMYDLPELSADHALLWSRVIATARRGGYAGTVPLTQMCGYPLVTTRRGSFEAIASPVYDMPFARGATHCGLIVVRSPAPYETLEDARGARFAFNGIDSNTGYNLPRTLFARYARAGRFFASVVRDGKPSREHRGDS